MENATFPAPVEPTQPCLRAAQQTKSVKTNHAIATSLSITRSRQPDAPARHCAARIVLIAQQELCSSVAVSRRPARHPPGTVKQVSEA